MKLRKQTRLKALITALTTGLFLLFLGLIRANPQIEAEADPAPQPQPSLDYERFFAPSSSTARSDAATPVPVERPHTRTRGS
jgi:hypothetical protein